MRRSLARSLLAAALILSGGCRSAGQDRAAGGGSALGTDDSSRSPVGAGAPDPSDDPGARGGGTAGDGSGSAQRGGPGPADPRGDWPEAPPAPTKSEQQRTSFDEFAPEGGRRAASGILGIDDVSWEIWVSERRGETCEDIILTWPDGHGDRSGACEHQLPIAYAGGPPRGLVFVWGPVTAEASVVRIELRDASSHDAQVQRSPAGNGRDYYVYGSRVLPARVTALDPEGRTLGSLATTAFR